MRKLCLAFGLALLLSGCYMTPLQIGATVLSQLPWGEFEEESDRGEAK